MPEFHRRHHDVAAVQIGLLDGGRIALRQGVAFPIVVVGVLADAAEGLRVFQLPGSDGVGFAEDFPHDFFGVGIAGGYGVKQAVGQIHRLRPPRNGAGGDGVTRQFRNKFVQPPPVVIGNCAQSRLGGPGQAGKVEIVGILHIRGGVAVRAVDAPTQAVGQHSDRAGAANPVVFKVTLNLAVGGIYAGAALRSAVEIGFQLFGLQHQRRMARSAAYGVQIAQVVGAVAAIGVFRAAMGGWIAQLLQHPVDQHRAGYGLVNSVQAAPVQIGVALAQRQGDALGGVGGGHIWRFPAGLRRIAAMGRSLAVVPATGGGLRWGRRCRACWASA